MLLKNIPSEIHDQSNFIKNIEDPIDDFEIVFPFSVSTDTINKLTLKPIPIEKEVLEVINFLDIPILISEIKDYLKIQGTENEWRLVAEHNIVDFNVYQGDIYENGLICKISKPYSSEQMHKCIKKDNIWALKYLHENGCPWDKDATRLATDGHLECLKYLHEKGCPWDEYTTRAAAMGHLECLADGLQQKPYGKEYSDFLSHRKIFCPFLHSKIGKGNEYIDYEHDIDGLIEYHKNNGYKKTPSKKLVEKYINRFKEYKPGTYVVVPRSSIKKGLKNGILLKIISLPEHDKIGEMYAYVCDVEIVNQDFSLENSQKGPHKYPLSSLEIDKYKVN